MLNRQPTQTRSVSVGVEILSDGRFFVTSGSLTVACNDRDQADARIRELIDRAAMDVIGAANAERDGRALATASSD